MHSTGQPPKCLLIRICERLSQSVCIGLLHRGGQRVNDVPQRREHSACGHLQAPYADSLDVSVHIHLCDVVGQCVVCL
jgi:hypothetical protein